MKFKTIKSTMITAVLMVLISNSVNCAVVHPRDEIIRAVISKQPLTERIAIRRQLKDRYQKELEPYWTEIAMRYLTTFVQIALLPVGVFEDVYAQTLDIGLPQLFEDTIVARLLEPDVEDFAEAAEAIFKSIYKISIAQGYLYAFDHQSDEHQNDLPPVPYILDLLICTRFLPPEFKGNFDAANTALLSLLFSFEPDPAAPSPIRMPFQPPVAAPPPPVRRVVEDTRLLTIEDLEMEFGLDLSSH